jgi:uncharacterized membrane protein
MSLLLATAAHTTEVPGVAMVTGAIGVVFGSIISVVIWILVMAWIYAIAKRKGRHAFGWLILGFFFFLLALVVVALLPSKRTTQAYEQM